MWNFAVIVTVTIIIVIVYALFSICWNIRSCYRWCFDQLVTARIYGPKTVALRLFYL